MNTFPSPPAMVWKTSRRGFDIGGRPLVMGVLNVTPDSFSDGGRYMDAAEAVDRAAEMAAQGADIIDVGGESTRPGAHPAPHGVEAARVLPAIREIAKRVPTPLSVDTRHPETARAAVGEGAEIVNDVGGLRHPEMRRLVRESGAAAVAMHMRGVPETMAALPPSPDIMKELDDFFTGVVDGWVDVLGLALDPGIGFGKTPSENLVVLNRLHALLKFGRPLLVGVSRKSFIGRVTGAPVGDRLPGSLAAAVLAYLSGARVVRCHDVAETVQALRVASAIRMELGGPFVVS